MARVVLRAVTEADLPDYVRWFNDPEVTHYLGRENGCTLEEEQEWFARISAPEERGRHWAIEAEGRHIGNCALIPHARQNKAGFGIVIGDKSVWGKGYGTAVLREVLRIGFAEMELHHIHLTVFPENQRGLRCYEKCGFRRTGYERQSFYKNGEWRDLIPMVIHRAEWEAQPRVNAAEVNGVVIRPYRSTDHPAVIALLELIGFHHGSNDTREMIEKKLATQPGFFFVAEADGRLVGTIIGSLERGWGWIQRLAVHPEYRRRGIAKRLLAEAERAHAALGAYRTVLLTHVNNEAAQALYYSLGYELWDGVIVMSRELNRKEAAGEENCCGS